MAKVRILTNDKGIKGSTSAYVVWGQNRLLQRRQFAWEGRHWLYQPSTREGFRPVSASEVPEPVVQAMAKQHGLSIEMLRGDDGIGSLVPA